MAIYRNVQMTFWTDVELVDAFTPEDKYFYLYLLTNPHTNLCGCYEISLKQISDETGYTKETIEKLIERMERTHRKIIFSPETKEVLIINWGKYNWTTSDKFISALMTAIGKVKNGNFKTYLSEIVKGNQDTVSIPYRYPMDTSVPVTDIYIKNLTDTNVYIPSNTKDCIGVVDISTKAEKYSESIKEIIDYLNLKSGKHYTGKVKGDREHIIARLKEGFTVDDFKKVIDNKVSKWLGDKKMDMYLRPKTLFSGNFEGYLNESETKKSEIDYSKHYYQKPEYVPQTEEEKRRSQEYWDSLEDEDDV